MQKRALLKWKRGKWGKMRPSICTWKFKCLRNACAGTLSDVASKEQFSSVQQKGGVNCGGVILKGERARLFCARWACGVTDPTTVSDRLSEANAPALEDRSEPSAAVETGVSTGVSLIGRPAEIETSPSVISTPTSNTGVSLFGRPEITGVSTISLSETTGVNAIKSPLKGDLGVPTPRARGADPLKVFGENVFYDEFALRLARSWAIDRNVLSSVCVSLVRPVAAGAFLASLSQKAG